jgi:hypothetical protein
MKFLIIVSITNNWFNHIQNVSYEHKEHLCFETRNTSTLLPLASSKAYVSGLGLNCKQNEDTILTLQLRLLPGAMIKIICEL